MQPAQTAENHAEKKLMRSLLEKSVEDFARAYIPQKYMASANAVALDDCILWAVGKAYGDMTPRTIKNHTAAMKGASIPGLARWFREYLDSTPAGSEDGFADCHRTACETFLNDFNAAAMERGVQPQAFGKAQKIVNMSFKYLYCMLRDEKAPWFSFCHMPLDSYTLNWFYGIEKARDLPKGTWSNLDDMQYYSIAKKIGGYVSGWPDRLSPLEAEFMIWPIEKSLSALKELKAAVSRSCSDPIIAAHLGQAFADSLQNMQQALQDAEPLTFERALRCEMQKYGCQP